MPTLAQHIQATIQNIFETEFSNSTTQVQVEYCDYQYGHLACNIALTAAKELNMKPMKIAQIMVDKLNQVSEISSAEVQQPGFINIKLSDDLLIEHIKLINDDIQTYIGHPGKGKKMAIDYSHPNIGKPMGVHHLLSTIIGDSIKLTYKQLGYEVIADNFIGDMGTQFGKLIHAVKTWGDMQAIEKNPVPELLKLYVRFHITADSDDTLDDAGRAEYKKLEEGDPENRALLKKIQAWSMAEILEIYNILGVEFDYFNGESFYEDKLSSIIDIGLQMKLFVKSQGALVCKLDNPDEPPALIQKSDGTSLYLTRDLARIKYWQDTWQPDLMVNVVDVAQTLQLKQLFEVANKLSLTDAKNIHVVFGRMNFKDENMSTRKGNIILVGDLLDTIRQKVNNQIVSLSKDLTLTEQKELCDILTINIIKYTILHQNRLSNITFDWDSALALEGDSAPYLAYSCVRMSSIKHNVELLGDKTDKLSSQRGTLDRQEIELILELSKLPQTFRRACEGFQPSELAHYCYELCRMYNSFYHTHRIIHDDNTVDKQSLLINNSVLQVIKVCFAVMGMQVPNKM